MHQFVTAKLKNRSGCPTLLLVKISQWLRGRYIVIGPDEFGHLRQI